METVMLFTLVLVVASCMATNLLCAYFLWTNIWVRKSQPQTPAEETEEEREARRVAAKAQAEYEQGFVNIMNYSGLPSKGECSN